MKKITYFSAAILATICGCFAACSDDDATSGVPVTEIVLSGVEAGGELTVKKLETLKVSASVSPDNASYKRVLFESNDTEIMTVNQAGVITGVSPGNATLRVFAADGSGVSVSYPVFVDYEAGVTNVRTPGTLAQLLGSEANTLTTLKLVGAPNDADFATMTGMAALQTLDMSATTVTAIPANAFKDASALTTVTFPATLTTIGANAFQNCTGLTSLTLATAEPPTTGDGAFEGTELANIALTVPEEATATYKGISNPWNRMRVNGTQPGSVIVVYTIPEAPAVAVWQTVTLETPLSTAKEWTIVAVSTQPTNEIDKLQFGSRGWGVHLLDIVYTGDRDGGKANGNGSPFEFYLGGPSQGGNKVGAIGRGNWNSSTQSQTPFAITLDKPVTITLTCTGNGNISCTVQNEGVNGGQPIDFSTIGKVLTVTAVKAALPTTTDVTITMKD
jgi:hypothetical protein